MEKLPFSQLAGEPRTHNEEPTHTGRRILDEKQEIIGTSTQEGFNTNEQQEMSMATITLLNIIDLST